MKQSHILLSRICNNNKKKIMKKIIFTFIAILSLFSMPVKAVEKSIGLSMAFSTIDSKVTDDIDNNGSIDTTKDISNDVGIPSLFFELSNQVGRANLSVGLDLIPLDAEFDSRTTSQSSIKEEGSATTTGNNKGTVDVSNHFTLYVRLGTEVAEDTEVYIVAGTATADVEADVQSISSTNKKVDLDLDGDKLGVGVKRTIGGAFIKLEYAEVDYDPISVVTSNSTKVTADMDTAQVSLSFGKSF